MQTRQRNKEGIVRDSRFSRLASRLHAPVTSSALGKERDCSQSSSRRERHTLKPYPIYDQNGQTWFPIYHAKQLENHTIGGLIYLNSPYNKGIPPWTLVSNQLCSNQDSSVQVAWDSLQGNTRCGGPYDPQSVVRTISQLKRSRLFHFSA